MSYVDIPWNDTGRVSSRTPIGFMINDAARLTIPEEWYNSSSISTESCSSSSSCSSSGQSKKKKKREYRPPTVDDFARLLNEYEEASYKGHNVVILGDGSMSMVAARDIQPGEELFFR